jgi:peptidoglycan/LPS O-acetylase OafA/YrhL
MQIYNPESMVSVSQQPGWITITAAAYFAVDVFFFIGGFLSCVVIIEKLSKANKASL